MKKVLLILLCCISFANAQQTLFRIDCDDGNDGNDGTSWPGFLTLAAAEQDGDFGAGDTLVAVGNCTEIFAPVNDGGSGNKCVLMDSLSFYDTGFSFSSPDTANLWSVTIAGEAARSRAILIDGDNFWTVLGVYLKGGTTANISVEADDFLLIQSKLDSSDAGAPALIIIGNSNRDSLISNLILGAGGNAAYGIWDTNDFDDGVMLNNTIYGNFTVANFFIDDSGTITKFQNNLAQNTSTVAADLVIRVDDGSQVKLDGGTWDRNLYWEATAITNNWRFNGSVFDVLATWIDSVNTHASGGAANSLDSDPALQSVITTCYILDSSPAFEAGTDLGYGDDMGYYQLPAAAPAGAAQVIRTRISQNVKPEKYYVIAADE